MANLSSIIRLLNSLLKKEVQWRWTKECEESFKKAKEQLVSSQVLVHYDPKLPIVLAGDAWAYGIGAAISHTTPDGQEHPIAYASRTLSKAEQNYSQVEKEALSLMFGIRKLHCYLYGRHYTLETDHKPLMTIFGPKKGVPAMAAARLQRWAIQLGSYHCTIKFRPTQKHANADGLSRLRMNVEDLGHQSDDCSVFNLKQIESLPVTATNLKKATAKDVILSKVLHFVKEGWLPQVEADLKSFYQR